MKKAIIIGAKGQDGRHLSAFLIKQNYIVLGVSKNSIACSDHSAWDPVDIMDSKSIQKLVSHFAPDEIYYLAAFHHSSQHKELIQTSEMWTQSFNVNVSGLINILEVVRNSKQSIRVFYASSCLIYGDTTHYPQNESTPYAPTDIYGITKMTATEACRFYRNQYNVFVAAGILYNHESAYRAPYFVTQKIIHAARSIKAGASDGLYLGDLSTEVDWGYAPQFVEAMYLILQQAIPEDFIIATGKLHTVKDFVEITFSKLGLDWTAYVKEDKSILHRKRGKLCGNSSKLQTMTPWRPSVTLEQIIESML